MADAAKPSEQPAKVTSSPARESGTEASLPGSGSVAVKFMPQPQGIEKQSNAPSKESMTEVHPSDNESVSEKAKPQPPEIKPSSSRLRRFVPVFLVLLLAVVLLI